MPETRTAPAPPWWWFRLVEDKPPIICLSGVTPAELVCLVETQRAPELPRPRSRGGRRFGSFFALASSRPQATFTPTCSLAPLRPTPSITDQPAALTARYCHTFTRAPDPGRYGQIATRCAPACASSCALASQNARPKDGLAFWFNGIESDEDPNRQPPVPREGASTPQTTRELANRSKDDRCTSDQPTKSSADDDVLMISRKNRPLDRTSVTSPDESD